MRFGFEGEAVMEENECMNMPPGFRFHPTDEEIITHYLSNKVLNNNFSATAMGEADLNKCEPWDLPKKAKMGEKAWYFFCQRDRKYPTGMRTNRATEAGYWKATGKDKDIYKGKRCLVGMKKTLVFYKGRAPKGVKTNWVMHEFRLEGKFSYCNLPQASQNEWVVCKVFHKTTGMKRTSVSEYMLESPSLHPLFDPPYSNTNQPGVGDFDDIHKRTITASRTSNGIHMSHLSTGMEDQLDYNSSQSSNIAFPCSSLSDLPLTIPGSANLGYLDHIRKKSIPIFPSYGCGSPAIAMLRTLASNDAASGLKIQCKAEQFSNQSIVSQDAGLSTEVNTEISSEASEHEIGSSRSYEDLKGIFSAIPAVPIDLECLWNY